MALPIILPRDWRPDTKAQPPGWNTDAHGFSSHHDWTFDEVQSDFAELSIAYPGNHPISRLDRRIGISSAKPQIEIDLQVIPRSDCRLPIGLHPVLRLPEKPNSVRLGLAEGVRAWTFPLQVEPGRTALMPDQRDIVADAVLDADGARIDLRSALPFAGASEDLVLLTGTGGWVDFDNLDEGYRVSLRWDPQAFPACNLWISNAGRQFYPWSGRFHGLGIEPVAAPFDLGTAIAADGNNPLARSGTPTAQSFRAGVPWKTSYSISCSALQ